MSVQGPYGLIKKILASVTYTCLVLIEAEGCQGCHREAIFPSPSESTSCLGGIPNVGNSCYVNSVLQIIAKLYPDVFKGQSGDLATAGQIIVDKIKNDQDYVTKDEARACRDAVVRICPNFRAGQQEDAAEAIGAILNYLGAPHILQIAEIMTTPGRVSGERDSAPKIVDGHVLVLPIAFDNGNSPSLIDCVTSYCRHEEVTLDDSINGRAQQQLLLTLTASDLLPIQLARFTPHLNKINTNVTNTLHLTIPANIQYSPGGHPIDLHYDLRGFIVHKGSTVRSGHYIACIQQAGQWKLYNDDKVTCITQEEVERYARQGYLYFYRKTSS